MRKALAATAALLTTLPAAAAGVSWTLGPTFGGPTGHLGILTNGTLVDAVHVAGTDVGTIAVDPLGLNLVFRNVNSPFFNTAFTDTPNNIGDPGWAAVVQNFEYSASIDIDAPNFLSGLTVGATYQIQFFSGRSLNCCSTRELVIGDGLGNVSTPVSQAPNVFQSVVATFVADGSTQRFVFDDNTDSPNLSAYVLREVTPVPEPGTWALMVAGLALVGRRARRLGAA